MRVSRLRLVLVWIGVAAWFGACASVPRVPDGPLPRGIPEAMGEVAQSHLVYASVSDLAGWIRQGEVTSVEVVEAFIAQIAAHNDDVNAIVLLDVDGAVARAREADAALARGEVWGPLHGVPVTIKDSIATAGLRTTSGFPGLWQFVPRDNAVVVDLLVRAGAIVLGKSNLAMLAMDMQTLNPIFGQTNNPWDLRRTAGGSTGGGAAALASGMTPLSIGSDLAGSIRLPAAFNGVFGLTPTFGTVSLVGHIPPLPGEVDGTHAMARIGPLARSVDDLELALAVLNQSHERDGTVIPLSAWEGGAIDVSGLTIAVSEQLGGVPVAADIGEAIGALAARLERAGAGVVRLDDSELDVERIWELWGTFVGMQGGYDRSNAARRMGRFFVRNLVRDVPMHRRILDPITVPGYMDALEGQRAAISALEALLNDVDVWICPVASTTAFAHHRMTRRLGEFPVYNDPLLVDGQGVHYYVATQAYTTVFAVTESPVVAMPIGLDGSGLPIGVQVVGHRFDDYRLLAIVRALVPFTEPTRYPYE